MISFGSALVLSLFLTPIACWIGKKYGVMDMPGGRKIHSSPIPRSGGLALFTAYLLSLAIVYLADVSFSEFFLQNSKVFSLFLGAMICFSTGLLDDFYNLSAKKKLIMQILAVTVAYVGGTHISAVGIFGFHLQMGMLDYGLTVLYFLLFINAVNLIDGLDGLAGGVTFFAALVMIALSVMSGKPMVGVMFAALAGSIMGFLRYNFHPASIFLGDSGSYFIGYTLAGLSIFGNVESQVSAAILIPVIALGLPLFDTLLSSLRRFIRGRRIFDADSEHIHHKLIARGLSAPKAVILMYAISIGLCLLSLFMVRVQEVRFYLLLMLLLAGAVALAHQLRYFDYIKLSNVWIWFKDILDETGISQARRSFLDIQIMLCRSRTVDEIWHHLTMAMDVLNFDQVMLYVDPKRTPKEMADQSVCYANGYSRRATSLDIASVCMRQVPPEYKWMRKVFKECYHPCSRSLFRLELPLEVKDNPNKFGTLVFIKDNRLGCISHFALKRVEHLRRSIISTFGEIQYEQGLELKKDIEQRSNAAVTVIPLIRAQGIKKTGGANLGKIGRSA